MEELLRAKQKLLKQVIDKAINNVKEFKDKVNWIFIRFLDQLVLNIRFFFRSKSTVKMSILKS